MSPVPAAQGGADATLSFEPIDPDAENPFKMRKRQAQSSTPKGGEATPPNAAPAGKKDYVFIPKPKAPSRFSDEDLEFNDPLK